MDDIKLVFGDIPTGRQFNAPRRYCGNYAQVAEALFMERTSPMGGWVDFRGHRCIYPAATALTPFVGQSRAAECERLRPARKRLEAQRQQDMEALYPGYELGDTGNSEWAFKQDMVAWVGERPRPG